LAARAAPRVVAITTWKESLPTVLDSKEAWAAGRDGRELFHTADGGATWQEVPVAIGAPRDVELLPPYFVSSKAAFVPFRKIRITDTSPSGLASTHDGGLTWGLESFPAGDFEMFTLAGDKGYDGRLWLGGGEEALFDQSAEHDNCMEAAEGVGTAPVIYFRPSREVGWRRQALPLRNGCPVTLIQVSEGLRAVAVAGNSIIFSRDAGQHWQVSAVQSVARVEPISLQLLGDLGWIANKDGRILETADCGEHWREIPGTADLRVRPAGFGNWGEVYFTSPDVGFTLRGEGLLFESRDRGRTWLKVAVPRDATYLTCGTGRCWLMGYETLYRVEGE